RSHAVGDGSLALGRDAVASGASSTAVGASARAQGSGAAALGSQAMADGRSALALGEGARATGADTLAAGRDARATAIGAVAIGSGSLASEAHTVSFGGAGAERRLVNVGTGLAATDAVNLGQMHATVATATATIAGATATGAGAAAAGQGAAASGTRSAAFGANALASGAGGVAIGAGAQALADGSVALGPGAVASAPGTVSVGAPGAERRIVNLAPGQGASDAATVGQVDASAVRVVGRLQPQINTLGGRVTGLSHDIDALGRRVAAVSDEVGRNRLEARRGIGAAMAMTGAPMPSAPGRTSWAVNTAMFQGELAIGAAVSHRFDTRAPLALNVGISHGGGSQVGARVGLAGEF
ncbi:MAG TPA: YadA-like family protein, partial [Salinarimonas sp.]|nr:YadA-like family protein [Salinarimonas sp.]